MKRLAFIILLCCCSLKASTAIASEPTASAIESVIQGSSTTQEPRGIQNYGAKVAKGFLYAMGALLIIVSLYKHFLGKKSTGSAADNIEILSQRSLGGRSGLLLVRTRGREFLLAQAGEQVTLLSPLDFHSGQNTAAIETQKIIELDRVIHG